MHDKDGGIPEEIFGYQRSSEPNAWASCVRIIDPHTGTTLSAIELDHNEAAFSLDVCTFDSTSVYVLIGTAQNVILAPRSCTSGFLRLYKFNPDGTDMELCHTVITFNSRNDSIDSYRRNTSFNPSISKQDSGRIQQNPKNLRHWTQKDAQKM